MNNFFDIQVNGFGGVDFNSDSLTGDDLHSCCEKMREGGVGAILATIITDDLKVMAQRLARMVELRNRDPLAQSMIPGFHIEGPFINEQPGYRGAHPADAIRPADRDEMKRLLDAGAGLTRLVTLAPERDPGLKTTSMLAQMGITVSGGHSNAEMEDLRAAIASGLSMWTHLGNGCPMQIHRHENIVQRVLSLHKHIWCCFIADGAHIPFYALSNYLRVTSIDRAIVVTDAIQAAGSKPGRYKLSRWDILIGEDMVARAPDGSHLVGSAMTMRQAVKNLSEKVGLSDADITRLTVTNPRKALPIPG